jgi:hypothetical protein
MRRVAYVPKRYVNAFSENHAVGLRIGVYHSLSRDNNGPCFNKAMARDTISLGRRSVFCSVDTEALDPDTRNFGGMVRRAHLDAIISTDGDGDRPMLSDRNGHITQVIFSAFHRAIHKQILSVRPDHFKLDGAVDGLFSIDQPALVLTRRYGFCSWQKKFRLQSQV